MCVLSKTIRAYKLGTFRYDASTSIRRRKHDLNTCKSTVAFKPNASQSRLHVFLYGDAVFGVGAYPSTASRSSELKVELQAFPIGRASLVFILRDVTRYFRPTRSLTLSASFSMGDNSLLQITVL